MSYTLSMPIIYSPLPTQSGANGLGKLFVGVVDGDPANTPADRIQVYLSRQNDTDLAISQPIDISAGGVPLYNGSPATLKINSEHSVAVLDYLDNQIYYSPKAGEEIQEIQNIASTVATRMRNISTFSVLRNTEPLAPGEGVEVNGHTVAGIGGGNMYHDPSDTTSIDNDFDVIVTPNGARWKRPEMIAYSIEMAGGLDNNSTDNKLPFERVASKSGYVFMPGDGTYLFSSPPSFPATATAILNRSATLSGATKSQINAKIVDSGQLCGVPFAPELRDKKIEIVAGTIRAQQNQAVTITFMGGGSSQVTQPNHGYSNGDYIVISGVAAPHGEFMNGTKQIGSVSTNTYNILTGGGTPAGTVGGFAKKPGLWEWIKDGTHEPIGVNDAVPAQAASYGIVIPFTKTYSRVLSVVCGPDETMSSGQNISLGASVSLSALEIRASVNKTVAGRVRWDGAAWVTSMGAEQGQISGISYANGNLTMSHSWCPSDDVQLTPDSVGGSVNPYIPAVHTINPSSAVINFISLATGGIYTGSAPDTQMSFRFRKNYNSIISFSGSDGSGEIGLQFGNIWFLGFMEV